jgi:GntR family transcriptional regulator
MIKSSTVLNKKIDFWIVAPMVIDRKSPVPLYHQVKEVILDMVRNGSLEEGDPLPSEREICEELRVSRITVGRAMSELVRESYLVRLPGKGTFVTRPKFQRHISRMQSFSEDMTGEGRQPGSRLLMLRHDQAGGLAAAALGLGKNKKIWTVQRLRLANDEPVCLSTAYLKLPPHLFLAPNEFEHQTSLWSILESKGVIPWRGEEKILAVVANAEHAELLEVEPGFPLLSVQGLAFTEQDDPFEFHQMFMRADQYEYVVQSRRETGFPSSDLKISQTGVCLQQ